MWKIIMLRFLDGFEIFQYKHFMNSNPSFSFGETCTVWTKDNRKVLGVPQLLVAANPWHQEEDKRDND